MKNFFQKQKEAIVLLVYAGIISASIFFVIIPLLERINGVKDQIQEEGMRQEVMKQNLSKLPKMQQQYDILQKDENLINVLLDKNDAIMLIERLEKIAQDSGNKITISIKDENAQKNTLSVKKTSDKPLIIDSLPSPDFLQMKISLNGNYNTIANYIELLENFEYYCDIVGIQIGGEVLEQKEFSNATSSPFSRPEAEVEMKKTPENVEQETLAASLDVVFYTRK